MNIQYKHGLPALPVPALLTRRDPLCQDSVMSQVGLDLCSLPAIPFSFPFLAINSILAKRDLLFCTPHRAIFTQFPLIHSYEAPYTTLPALTSQPSPLTSHAL
jgi:hypothetical protein